MLWTSAQKAGDERIWKLIIPPEFGEPIDLRKLTRELLTQMGRDNGSELEWVAAAHYNTEHPHVHVALRGAVANGKALHLEREYVKHGIRPSVKTCALDKSATEASVTLRNPRRGKCGSNLATIMPQWKRRQMKVARV